MRARYYNPRIMRFCNADPIGFGGGTNWYAFAGNNPISAFDPFGLDSRNSSRGMGGLLNVFFDYLGRSEIAKAEANNARIRNNLEEYGFYAALNIEVNPIGMAVNELAHGTDIYGEPLSWDGYLLRTGAAFEGATSVYLLTKAMQPTSVVLHKNSNSYVGPQAVYKIDIDDDLHKYGKADLKRMSSTGLPSRLQTQINRLSRKYPLRTVKGKVLFKSQKISTRDIKLIETDYIQKYFDENGELPPGNQGHPGIKP